MKKVIFFLLILWGSLQAGAQTTPHAIGVHLGGSTLDLEYQYHFSKKNFLDVTAGVFDLNDGFSLQAAYNWNLKQWSDWTPNFGTWKVWGGFGAGLGYYNETGEDGLFFGPLGDVGFGFTLNKCPLTVGVDYRPMLALNTGDGFGIIGHGFYNLGLTVTYRF